MRPVCLHTSLRATGMIRRAVERSTRPRPPQAGVARAGAACARCTRPPALDNALCETTIGLYKTECVPFDPYLNEETTVEIRHHWKGPFHFGAPDGVVVNVTKDDIWC